MDGSTFTVLKIPISVVVNWPKANYENPERRTWAIPVSITLTVFTTILIAARILARFTRRAGTFGLDDALIVGAWACTLGYTVLTSIMIDHKVVGIHSWNVRPQSSVWAGKLGFAAFMLLVWGNLLTKMSILLFYRRIVNRSYSRVLQWAIYAVMGIVVASLVGLMLGQILLCRPISAYWEGLSILYDHPDACGSFKAFNDSASCVLIVSDILTLAIPPLVIFRLQLPRLQKIVLSIVFGCGIIAVAAGIVRLHFISIMFRGDYDTSWVAYDVFLWVEIELQLAMMCASMPALKGFLSNSLRDRREALPIPHSETRPKASQTGWSFSTFAKSTFSTSKFASTKGESQSENEEGRRGHEGWKVMGSEEAVGMHNLASPTEQKDIADRF